MASGLSTQGMTVGMTTCRRHLPMVMTSGMLLPAGTFSSTNRPLVSVSAVETGLPGRVSTHLSQLTPSLNGVSGELLM